MKTSRRKYNGQYRRRHLYVDGCWKPEIVPACTEHKRCGECGSHVKLSGFHGVSDGWMHIYECPTCGKCYAVFHKDTEEEGV